MTTTLQSKLKELNNKWHGAIANAMGIESDENFQIAQGDLGLSSSDSSALFLMSDAVPPKNLAAYYTVDYSNKISSSYGNFLDSLSLTQNGDLLNTALDAYVDINNKKEFLSSDKKAYYLYMYSLTIDKAKEAISMGKSIDNFSFDSSIAEVDLKKMSDSVHISGVWDAFSAFLDINFETIIARFLESKITVEAHIDKYAKVPTLPVGWYNSDVANIGFEGKDDPNVWDLQAQQGWNDFFKQANGGLARHIDQFLLVSGYEFTVKFHSKFTQEDFELFKSRATFTLWPFFSASLDVTHRTNFVLGDDDTLSYTIKSSPGDIKILGITYKSFV